jgi:hypothetical protein
MSHTSRLGFGMGTAFTVILDGIIEQSNAFDVVALSDGGLLWAMTDGVLLAIDTKMKLDIISTVAEMIQKNILLSIIIRIVIVRIAFNGYII